MVSRTEGARRGARRGDRGGAPADDGTSPRCAVACRDVWKRYTTAARAVDAVRGIDLDVPSGQWLAVMGPSGSGKSSLLQLMGGLDVPDRGTIEVAGVALHGLSETKRAVLRRRRIGYVFQFFNLVTNLSAGDNVELPLLLAGVGRRQARHRREELPEQLGIAEVADAAPAELSGGQQQRVAIARAVANGPDVLLADEPTGNLDRASTAEVLALLGRMHRAGQTIVMVTHDHAVAAAADAVVTVVDGRIADSEGPPGTPPLPGRPPQPHLPGMAP